MQAINISTLEGLDDEVGGGGLPDTYAEFCHAYTRDVHSHMYNSWTHSLLAWKPSFQRKHRGAHHTQHSSRCELRIAHGPTRMKLFDII